MSSRRLSLLYRLAHGFIPFYPFLSPFVPQTVGEGRKRARLSACAPRGGPFYFPAGFCALSIFARLCRAEPWTLNVLFRYRFSCSS